MNNLFTPKFAGHYRCLVVDPPWNQRKTGRRSVRPNQGMFLDYKTMSCDQIKQLPIREWAAENAFIWLWATNSKDGLEQTPILKAAFEILEYWGFSFYTMLTWDKKTGPCPFGPYQITSEYALFGYRGKFKVKKDALGKAKSVFQERTLFHSQKPNWLYEHIASNFDGPRLDVFARQRRPGFDGWGDEYPHG